MRGDGSVGIGSTATKRRRGRALIASSSDEFEEEQEGATEAFAAPSAGTSTAPGVSHARPDATPLMRVPQRPRRAAAAAAMHSRTPGRLNLQRGIRFQSEDSDTSDSAPGEDRVTEEVRGRCGRRGAGASGSIALRRSTRRRVSDGFVPEYTPGHVDRRFYEYRSKVKVPGINVEKMSSDDELSSDFDGFIVGDGDGEEGDDNDDTSRDDDGDDDDDNVDSPAAASTSQPLRDVKAEAKGDAKEGRLEEDSTSVGRRRNLRRGARAGRKSGVLISDDEIDAATNINAVLGGRVEETVTTVEKEDEDEDEGLNLVRHRRRTSSRRPALRDDECVDSREDDLRHSTLKSPPDSVARTSQRISSKRARKSEIWQQKLSELREGMQRERETIEAEEDDQNAEYSDSDADWIVADDGEVEYEEALDNVLKYSNKTAAGSDVEEEEEREEEWVHCTCGALADDHTPGILWVQCCNARCGVWQHATCVGVDVDESDVDDLMWFCSSCSTQGGKDAPTPPHKPKDVGISIDPPTWSGRLTQALLSDDPVLVRGLLASHPHPPSRGIMLSRAASAAASKCTRMFLGGAKTASTAVTGTQPAPAATQSEVAKALHRALSAGNVEVVEVIREVLGPRFIASRGWPRGSKGATLVHSAADNAKKDPRCVWLALEAEGEPPGPGDERSAANLALSAAAVVSPPTASLYNERQVVEDADGGVDVGEAAGVEARDIVSTPPDFTPSAASSLIAVASQKSVRPVHNRAAAAVADEEQVTPLMRAARAGPGWEGCLAALLWSVATRNCRDSGNRAVVRGGGKDFTVAAAAAIALRDEEFEATAAHYAAGSGAVTSLRLLSDALPGCLRAVDITGATPLHHAAAHGQEECIRVMTDELGVSRTITDSQGWIPLLYADWGHRRGAVLTLMASHLQEQLAAMHAIIENQMSRPRVLKVLRMLATVPPFYDALNTYISKHIDLLSGPLCFLLDGTTIVDFANRRTWLQQKLQELQRVFNQHWRHGSIQGLRVRHSLPWGGFCRWAMRGGTALVTAVPLHYHMHFSGVMSVASGPGVEREFMDRIAANLMHDFPTDEAEGEAVDEEDDEGMYYTEHDDGSMARDKWQPSGIPLLVPASEGLTVYHPPLLPEPLPRQLEEEYTVLGWLLGYAILHRSPFPVAFSSTFLKGLLGRADRATWDDLEEMAPETARGLTFLRDMESGVDALALTFSVEEEHIMPAANPGALPKKRVVEIELVSGGASRAVTDANKDEYVKLALRYQLRRISCSAAVAAVRTGLNEIISQDLLRVFTAHEMACLFGGTADISVSEWRQYTNYQGGYDEDSPQIKWFWRLVERFTPDERTLLLKFVTGSSRMPTGGFGSLQYHQRFTVMQVPAERSTRGRGSGDANHAGTMYALPTSATCFNTLRLPAYPTFDDLEQQVTTALRHGCEGFAFG